MPLKILLQCHKIAVQCHNKKTPLIVELKISSSLSVQFLTAEFIVTDKGTFI